MSEDILQSWRDARRRARMGIAEEPEIPGSLYLEAAHAYQSVEGVASEDGRTKRIKRKSAIEAVIRATLDHVAPASDTGREKA